MDAGTLRIILIVLGVLLLGALYLRERERIEHEAEPDEPEPRKPPRSSAEVRREPSLGERFADSAARDETALSAEAASRARGDVDDHRERIAARQDLDSLKAGPASGAGDQADAPERKALRRSSTDEQQRASPAPSDDAGLLVQLFVVARAEPFDGLAVLAAAERHHLAPGEMDIYHRHNLESSSQRALFSMANLVKPGTFPLQAMEGFSTPGLALFTQLDGMPSDLMVYDELVQTARLLADEFDADLVLPNRRPFDDDAWLGLRIELLSLISDRADALTSVHPLAPDNGPAAADAANGDETHRSRP